MSALGVRQSPILDVRGAPIVVNRAPGSLYEGASSGARSKYWYAPATGPNASLTGSLANLRNRIGKRIAVWMLRDHPGEYDGRGFGTVRVRAADIIHHYPLLPRGRAAGLRG